MSRNLPYDRAQRVADRIHNLLSQKMLSDISDPRLAGIQITRVAMTKDLRIARIYYHMMDASDEQRQQAERGFGSAAGFFRRMIGEEISLKFTPEVEFYYDESIDVRERIEELLAGNEGG
jgi:ribosome-binding factor A